MSALDPQPYVFAIIDFDRAFSGSIHAQVAQKLTNAGFDVGLMLWTASPHIYTANEIKQFWQEALERAGIESLHEAHDEEKRRTWYKVYRKQP